MKKYLIFISFLIISIVGYSQSGTNPNYTQPDFQGNVIVQDTLGIEDAIIFGGDTVSSFFSGEFDGDRNVKSSNPTVGVNYGGTTLGEWLNNVFFPFIPATITLNSSTYLVEVGTNNTLTLSGATTLNDETVLSAGKIVKLPSTDLYSFGASASYSTTDAFYPTTATSVQYKSQQTGDNEGSPTIFYSPTRTINSVYTFLYGMSSSDYSTGGTAPYSGLTKLVQAKSNKTVTLNGSNEYIYFCYPASYGNLTSVLDQNGFENIQDFTKYTVDVTSVGLDTDYTVSYNIYKYNSLTAVPSANWQFKF